MFFYITFYIFEIDDIILVGNQSDAFGVIKIINIYDEEGVDYDRYDINIKIANIVTGDVPDDTQDVVEE